MLNHLCGSFCDNGDEWVHLRIERDLKNIVTAPRGKKLPEGENLSEYRGYVYFVTSTEMDTVKIGYSKNPGQGLENYDVATVVILA